MALVGIGPVALDEHEHGNPTWSMGGGGSPLGVWPASVGGLMPWAKAMTLLELTHNRASRETIGDDTGVKEYIEYGGSLLSTFSGWYLITGFNVDPTKAHTVNGGAWLPFSLTAVYLGDLA